MRSGFPKINREDLGAYEFFMPDESNQNTAVSVIAEIDKLLRLVNEKTSVALRLRTKCLAEIWKNAQ